MNLTRKPNFPVTLIGSFGRVDAVFWGIDAWYGVLACKVCEAGGKRLAANAIDYTRGARPLTRQELLSQARASLEELQAAHRAADARREAIAGK